MLSIHTKVVRHQILPIAAAFIVATAGCSSPRVSIDSPRQIGKATGVDSPIEFRVVGPDGGPIDEPDGVRTTLTFHDAVRRAVTTDPGLQAALARVQIAAADADQARLLSNPILNVMVRWGPGKPMIEASLAQDFIQALQIPRQASAADNRLRQVAADAVTVALDVTSEVQERYTDAQASATLLPVMLGRLALIEKLTATAQARLDAGEGTRGDVATLHAQRVELQVEIDSIQLSAREQRLRLARLIGEPSSAAAWTLDAWTMPVIGQQPEAAWVDAGLMHRPEIQAIAWKLKALGDDEAIARLLPWEGASAGVDATKEEEWSIGPAISTPIPVFDTGQVRRKRITAEQIEARHDLTLAKRKVVEEIRIAFQTLTASTANLARIRDELIPLQNQRRQLAEDSYRAGQTDVTAMFLAEQDLRMSQAQSIEVERQAVIALVRLQRAVGGPGIAATVAAPSVPSAHSAH